ncbi:MAG: hypothetical protein O2812_04230 [Chloroflexi bacterium]|nr:hypothetical protein [Chloroflexota bacterium]
MADRIVDHISEAAASKAREGQHQVSASLAAIYGELSNQDPEMVTLDLTGEHNEYHLRLSLGLAKKLLKKLDGLDL